MHDRVDVEVTVTQRAEGTLAPEIRHHALGGDHTVDHGPANILEMQMVDPVGPLDHRSMRVATAEHQVTGIQAESDIGPVEHLPDLLWRFDVAGAVMVEGWFVTTLPAERDCHVNAAGETGPTAGIEHQRWIVMRAPWRPPAGVGTGVCKGGSRRSRGLPIHAVEDIEETTQLVQRGWHPIRFGERHRDVAAGEGKATAVKAIRQLAAMSEVARRPEVDAGVPGARNRIEPRQRIGDIRIDADRDLEGTEGDRRAGDGDRCGQVAGEV